VKSTFRSKDGAVDEYIQAYHRWKNNADLIANAIVPMGYIRPDDRVIDVTYGRGNWWTLYRPEDFYYHDWKLDKVDFTDLPYEDEQFDVVGFDPPYKMNGTTQSSLDDGDFHDRWGLVGSAKKASRYRVIKAGLKESARVLRGPTRKRGKDGGLVLLKCQNQSQGAGVHWQTYDFKEYGEKECGLRLVDEFHMIGHTIKQQPNRRQKRAHGRPSVMMVMQKVV
jgi:hypothetical protein